MKNILEPKNKEKQTSKWQNKCCFRKPQFTFIVSAKELYEWFFVSLYVLCIWRVRLRVFLKHTYNKREKCCRICANKNNMLQPLHISKWYAIVGCG